jgi:hypothetical protein
MERKIITDVYFYLPNATNNKIIFQIPSLTEIHCMNKLTTIKENTAFFTKDTATATDTVVAVNSETSTGGNGTGGKGGGGKPKA